MADTFHIRGGKKLRGTIAVRGAKNSALKILAATLLTSEPVTLKNVPEVEDVLRILELLQSLGCSVKRLGHGKYRVHAKNIWTSAINPEISKRIRASIVLTGPLFARTGSVSFPHPGGCVIGKRPIDVFLDGFKAFGASVQFRGGTYQVSAPRIAGTGFFFNLISVTGTETMMMLAVLAKGRTVLKNCACEPEIASLAGFLNSCGARISGAGTPTIVIDGVSRLHGGTHTIIPDRIETGTFAILAAASGGDITITDCEPAHVESLWCLLRKMGVRCDTGKRQVRIRPVKRLKSVDIKTHEYPGFPTDLQAPFCVLLTQAEGSSLVHETIYEGRLAWTEDLKRMGAKILTLDPHRVQIQGPATLEGKEIKSPDIRAGMALIIAALVARKKRSVVHNIYQIDRGYEKIEERLRGLGADITRV